MAFVYINIGKDTRKSWMWRRQTLPHSYRMHVGRHHSRFAWYGLCLSNNFDISGDSCLFHMFAPIPFHRMELVWSRSRSVYLHVCVCLTWVNPMKTRKINATKSKCGSNSENKIFEMIWMSDVLINCLGSGWFFFFKPMVESPLGEIQLAKVPTLNHSKHEQMAINKCSFWLSSHTRAHLYCDRCNSKWHISYQSWMASV